MFLNTSEKTSCILFINFQLQLLFFQVKTLQKCHISYKLNVLKYIFKKPCIFNYFPVTFQLIFFKLKVYIGILCSGFCLL